MRTEQSKRLIEQALKYLPGGMDCRDARIMLTKALNEIEKIELKAEKKGKNLSPLQKWQLDTKTGNLISPFMSEHQRKNALVQIEDLIKQEESKLKSKNVQNDVFLD